RGVVSGLQLAWERVYRKIQLRLDSHCVVVVLLLQNEGHDDHAHATTLFRARDLQRDWEVQIIHVYREGNHTTDYFDNMIIEDTLAL
ncbi:Putative ribonuclease H protein At1g65750, partial [Linum perenne]